MALSRKGSPGGRGNAMGHARPMIARPPCGSIAIAAPGSKCVLSLAAMDSEIRTSDPAYGKHTHRLTFPLSFYTRKPSYYSFFLI